MNTTHFLGWFLNKQQAPSYIINHRCKWEIIDADQKQRLLPTPGRHHVAFKARAEKKKKTWSTFKRASSPHLFSWPWFCCVCVFAVALLSLLPRGRLFRGEGPPSNGRRRHKEPGCDLFIQPVWLSAAARSPCDHVSLLWRRGTLR